LKKFKTLFAFILVCAILCASTFAVPFTQTATYGSSAKMQYMKAEQLAAYLCAYHLDSGLNDQPMLRAYQKLFDTTKDLSDNALRKALISYFSEDKDNYFTFATLMCQMYDAHTYFFSEEQFEIAFPDELDYEGVGMTVRPYGNTIVIASVYKDSPADRAGIEANDRILKVGDTDLRLLSYEESISVFADAVKKQCDITLCKYTTGAFVTVSLSPEVVDIPNVEYALLEPGIGYIKLNQFSGSDFIPLLDDARTYFTEHDVKKVVLDLRDNPGGDLNLLLYALNFFIPEKNIPMFDVIMRGNGTTYQSQGTGYAFEKIAILVNASSASSSEICAGVLSDTGYATVFGETTYGKARGQTTMMFYDDHLLHMSMSEVRLPVRGKYHGIGIVPDRAVELTLLHAFEDLPADTSAVDSTSASEAIAALQHRLYVLGYLGTYKEGALDDATIQGLHELQTALNLEKSDSCNEDTMEQINSYCKSYENAYFIEDTQISDAIAYLTESVN